MTLRTLLALALLTTAAHAEDGHAAWLRYAPLPSGIARQYRNLPGRIVCACQDRIETTAAQETAKGLSSMLGRPFSIEVFGKNYEASSQKPALHITISKPTSPQQGDSFSLALDHSDYWLSGASRPAELYAAFRLLELVASQQPIPADLHETPAAPIRWVNQWDNFDGTIERGYAGRSLFFDAGHVRADLSRVSAYGRLLASVGINGLTVNNVNADLRTLDPAMLRELARIADALRPWGIRMSLSIDLSSPQAVGHLNTFDPLDPTVIAWWQSKVDEIYTLIPDFGGFTVKADSEGRPGPSQYHRTPAEAANVLARALAPHGGYVLYRGFVYNHHLDWHDLKADRARAGYDNFRALDGQFQPNVIIQIKHGPIDFQVREPVSPLFAALQHTSQAIELQTSQEYTGQQRHMVFLVPMWKWALDTDLRAQNRSTPVKEIVEGKSFHQPLGGFVSVVNVGLDSNWLHHPMALANLYGFGKLAWNPNASATSIIDTWTRLTFGNNPKVVSTIDALQLGSWHAYEQYTGPLGIGTLTDIIGVHFGPNPGSAENNGWGQWFRGDKLGVGMDRTVSTGTGYIGQYPPQLAAQYESLATCPDDLLLFMHHVPYTHRLHTGDTVLQHLYDAHYAGAATAATYVPRWQSLHGLIDDERYHSVLALFTYQAGHAIVWRDTVNSYFQQLSGIPDTHNHPPPRIEAESMTATGYTPVNVTPAETASGGKAMVCEQATCTLTATLRQSGTHRIAVQYFDLRSGLSTYTLALNGRQIASWRADDTLPPAQDDPNLDGHTSTRFTTAPIALHPNDILTLTGAPNGNELAPVDYLEIEPATPPVQKVVKR